MFLRLSTYNIKWLQFGFLLIAALVLGIFSPFEKAPWLSCFILVPFIHILRSNREIGMVSGLMTGWIFGSLTWASGTFWLKNAMETLMYLPPLQSWLSLSAVWLYQGIPFALFGAVCVFIRKRGYFAGSLFCASLLTLLIYLRPVLFPVSWTVAAALWAEFIQIADLGGEMLVCFFLIWINCLVSDMISGILGRDVKAFGVSLLFFSLLMISIPGYGFWKISRLSLDKNESKKPGLIIACLQPDVPVICDEKGVENFRTDEALSLQVVIKNQDLIHGADILVFPELPRFDCRSDEFEESGLKEKLQSLGIPVLLQGTEYIPAQEAPEIHTAGNGDRRIIEHKADLMYSSVFIMSPGIGCTLAYRKRIPVPFSETGLGTYLFPGKESKSDSKIWLSRGESSGLVKNGTFLIQPLICFESGFAELVRQGTRLGADILVEVSNDGWFFSQGAEMKHLGMGVFRAVEFRRPLVRCSNSGGGAHVMATGQIVEATLTPHGKACITKAEIFCPGDSTIFERWGNTWLSGIVFIVMWNIFGVIRKSRKGK